MSFRSRGQTLRNTHRPKVVERFWEIQFTYGIVHYYIYISYETSLTPSCRPFILEGSVYLDQRPKSLFVTYLMS